MRRRVLSNGPAEDSLPVDLRPFQLNKGLSVVPGGKNLGQYGSQITDPNIPEFDKSADVHGLPPDLWPFNIKQYGRLTGGMASSRFGVNELLARIANDTRMISSTLVLDRGLLGRVVTVGTTPVLLADAQFLRGYIFMNPAQVVGTTAVGTILTAASRTAAGNTQSDSIGVANYRDLHLFLDVTAVSGTAPVLTVMGQALDPLTLNWADSQAIWTGINATGTYYANIGSLGLASDFALRWTIGGSATPTFAFSVGFVIKEGLPGTGAGVGKTIYLGGPGVTTQSGFPLLEGQQKAFFMRENTELYAVAGASLEMRVFEL